MEEDLLKVLISLLKGVNLRVTRQSGLRLLLGSHSYTAEPRGWSQAKAIIWRFPYSKLIGSTAMELPLWQLSRRNMSLCPVKKQAIWHTYSQPVVPAQVKRNCFMSKGTWVNWRHVCTVAVCNIRRYGRNNMCARRGYGLSVAHHKHSLQYGKCKVDHVLN
jgi:hypothetical protein